MRPRASYSTRAVPRLYPVSSRCVVPYHTSSRTPVGPKQPRSAWHVACSSTPEHNSWPVMRCRAPRDAANERRRKTRRANLFIYSYISVRLFIVNTCRPRKLRSTLEYSGPIRRTRTYCLCPYCTAPPSLPCRTIHERATLHFRNAPTLVPMRHTCVDARAQCRCTGRCARVGIGARRRTGSNAQHLACTGTFARAREGVELSLVGVRVEGAARGG